MTVVPWIRALVHEAYEGYRRHLDLQLAAALAFFSSLALPPVAALALAGAEKLFGRDVVRQYAYDRVASTVGPEVARVIASAVEGYVYGRGSVPALLGTVGLFVASAGLVYQAQLSLRHVFEFDKPYELKRILKLRGLGLLALVVFVALVMVFFMVLALLSAVEALGSMSGAAANAAFALVVLVGAAFSYRWLSGRTIAWGAALAGGVVAAVSVLIGRSVFAIYLGVAEVGSAYGSFAAVFALLTWLYALGVVFLLGAEVSRAWIVLADRSD